MNESSSSENISDGFFQASLNNMMEFENNMQNNAKNEKSAEKFTVGKVDEVPIAAQRSYIKETNIEVLT